jgi:hypothetical protein
MIGFSEPYPEAVVETPIGIRFVKVSIVLLKGPSEESVPRATDGCPWILQPVDERRAEIPLNHTK